MTEWGSEGEKDKDGDNVDINNDDDNNCLLLSSSILIDTITIPVLQHVYLCERRVNHFVCFYSFWKNEDICCVT